MLEVSPGDRSGGNPTKSKLAFLALVMVCLCGRAKADGVPASSASTLSALMGTTCVIGNLQFAFNIGFSVSAPWSTSDFFFTPVPYGFTVSFDGGPQSVTSPQFETESASFLAVFGYSVTLLAGYGISSESVTGGCDFSFGFFCLGRVWSVNVPGPI